MKRGINMNAYPISIEEQVALMVKNGFHATFSMADSPTLDEEIRACRAAGIVHENLHAPFRNINSIWLEGREGDEMLASLIKAVDDASAYGIPTLVIHLSSGKTPPRVSNSGFSRFDTLFSHAKEKGVTLAIENQRFLGILALFMDYYPEAKFCFDTGHNACFTKSEIPFLELFGNRMVALHTHDNNTDADEHRLPLDADIDFTPLMAEIADTPYSGALMLEVISTHSPYYADTTADEYYARAAAAAQRLADLVAYHRTDY
ncbi:MAG: sugar phosphate isomerase/epimerase [Clostridia bacterium]|nr:sugar phosphate isomerase/epimerase [Clostridia bacterium]